ncbi:MAG TPA: ABC transporter substrate-binding protein [Acidobacteriaceae bacterium]
MRIVSLQPSITLTITALGRLDTLCGLTKYCIEAMPELASLGLPILHDSWTANTAEIAACQPDLVIASVPYRMESLAAILKSGLPVLALAPHSLADIFKDIRLLAALTFATGAGERLIATCEAELAAARALTDALPHPTVYCEEWGKPLIRSQRWVAELVAAAGGEYLGEPGAHTTAEEVAASDPDALVFAWCGAGDRVPLARVIEQRHWHDLRAVRNGNVFCVPDEFFNTPAHTLMEGLRSLTAALHPDRFPTPPRLVRHQKVALLRPAKRPNPK